LRPNQRSSVTCVDGRISGPILQAVLRQIKQLATFSSTLHITGESGSGKEGAAQAFHAACANQAGPFVAVNCAAIPQGVAERVLFGAKRGAFSGATADSDGYIQAAHNGTLFLDEIGELDQTVQAKLLRVLETREVCQLGSTKARPVNLILCSASNKDLRAEVSAGRFRADLYFRLSRPSIEIPPLRRRLEELPWFIERELRTIGGGISAGASFIEACLLRFWPGNVREFLTELRTSAHLALADGKRVVELRYLSPTAGQEFIAEPPADHPIVCPQGGGLSRAVMEKVLRKTGGNISAAARLLNMHRTQLKRNLDRLGIDAAAFASGTTDTEE
jgi:transcriptional regulator with PAS, ATPase and Fis domain